jgi:hypothetical protein
VADFGGVGNLESGDEIMRLGGCFGVYIYDRDGTGRPTE